MAFLQNAGLSHSEISGSKVICTYPELIAAYHVLHRLREPRHPPCALIYFLSNWLLHCDSWGVAVLLRRYQPIQWRACGSIYTFSSLLNFTFCFIMSKIVSLFQRSWRITDSNRWPSACKADALASWANPPRVIEHCNNVLATTIFVRSSPRQSWTADLYIISVAL